MTVLFCQTVLLQLYLCILQLMHLYENNNDFPCCPQVLYFLFEYYTFRVEQLIFRPVHAALCHNFENELFCFDIHLHFVGLVFHIVIKVHISRLEFDYFEPLDILRLFLFGIIVAAFYSVTIRGFVERASNNLYEALKARYLLIESKILEKNWESWNCRLSFSIV